MKKFQDKKALIVDDNLGFLNLLKIILSDLGLQHIYACTSAAEAYTFFLNNPIDLCIFDIELGTSKDNGIQLAEKIRHTSAIVPIIYITSHFTQDYYQSCRHTRPSSFMNKELSRFKLAQAIDLALLNSHNQNLTKSPPSTAPYISADTLFFKIGDRYKAFDLEEISFFFAKDKMVFARVKNRNYPTNMKLKTLEEELYPNFLRIHKSYLVNKQLITTIHIREEKIEIGKEILPIGYAFKKDFLAQIRIL